MRIMIAHRTDAATTRHLSAVPVDVVMMTTKVRDSQAGMAVEAGEIPMDSRSDVKNMVNVMMTTNMAVDDMVTSMARILAMVVKSDSPSTRVAMGDRKKPATAVDVKSPICLEVSAVDVKKSPTARVGMVDVVKRPRMNVQADLGARPNTLEHTAAVDTKTSTVQAAYLVFLASKNNLGTVVVERTSSKIKAMAGKMRTRDLADVDTVRMRATVKGTMVHDIELRGDNER